MKHQKSAHLELHKKIVLKFSIKKLQQNWNFMFNACSCVYF